ncbi:Ribonucleotide reductase inhibitor [Penicillium griseofulvum]|uniref:Ribonucleotide reductase inhibitor n=1 Tax=Penicillium patulum TaxID=5078 RepID=A0A135LJS6_PENPA|nr:Ribonucleotide reductase inhibitor [Penicillium griseofulvum]KXG49223.1 Ribonucleotide reductase inhibitor [Penicillium griseofulvum]
MSDLSKRRRFQPPITTFFTSASQPVSSATPAVSHHHHYAAETFSAHPVVPAKVQSSLLSVGMRVRKSVADGYKTHMSKTEEKAPLPAVAQTPRAQVYHGSRPSELSPFSGAPKTSFSDDYLVTDDGDAYSIPPSSQESTVSLPLGGQKRALELDGDILVDEDVDESFNNFGESWHETSYGRTILSPNLGQSRRILAVRQKKIDQPTMDMDDFEEATFLRRREEVDAEDVRMYGA